MQAGYLKRVVFISIFWSATIITLFAIYAFGPQMLKLFGLQDGNQAELGYGLINLFFFLGNVVALLLVERMGRRPILIGGFAISGLGLLYLAVFPDSSLLVVAAAFAVYAIFNGGPSILEWIYPNELFPTEIRASAVGLCTGISRIGAAIGTFATPWALTELGISTTMYIATAATSISTRRTPPWWTPLVGAPPVANQPATPCPDGGLHFRRGGAHRLDSLSWCGRRR